MHTTSLEKNELTSQGGLSTLWLCAISKRPLT